MFRERGLIQADAVEITDVTLSGVTGRELSEDGWTQTRSAPEDANANWPDGQSAEQSREMVRERIRNIAEQAVIQAGDPAQMQRYVYRPLLDHVSERFLDGEALPFAEREAVYRAGRYLNQLEAQISQRPDIVGGMVEYGAG